MNTYELRLNPQPFESIKLGTKTIEMRLLDEKRQQYNVGDVLIFKNRANQNEKLITKIIQLHKYSSFEDLYKNFDKISLGYKENEDAKPEDMEEYYSKEKQANFGVVGIEIQLI